MNLRTIAPRSAAHRAAIKSWFAAVGLAACATAVIVTIGVNPGLNHPATGAELRTEQRLVNNVEPAAPPDICPPLCIPTPTLDLCPPLCRPTGTAPAQAPKLEACPPDCLPTPTAPAPTPGGCPPDCLPTPTAKPAGWPLTQAHPPLYS